jgi:hypothetical protein
LIDVLLDQGVAVPGLKEHDDTEDDKVRMKAARAIGKVMGQCFEKEADRLDIDGMCVERRSTTDFESRQRWDYRFSSELPPNPPEWAPNETPNQNSRVPNPPNGAATFSMYSESVPENVVGGDSGIRGDSGLDEAGCSDGVERAEGEL